MYYDVSFKNFDTTVINTINQKKTNIKNIEFFLYFEPNIIQNNPADEIKIEIKYLYYSSN